MQTNGEQFTQDPYRIGYIIEEHSASDWLCVCFASNAQAGAKKAKPYPFLNLVSGFPCHILHIRDAGTAGGCGCLCEHLDFAVADTVCRLIEEICAERRIPREHLILMGTSDGASAALYFGLRLGAGHVVGVNPVVKLGSACRRNDALWAQVAGAHCAPDMAQGILDQLIPDLLPHAPNTVLHLQYAAGHRPDVLFSARDSAVCKIDGGEVSHRNQTLSAGDYVSLTLFGILCLPVTVQGWDDNRILAEVDGVPQGDLCLDLLDEDGARAGFFKLHSGKNEMFVDRFGSYTPILRYPVRGVELELRERFMGGKQFVCSALSLESAGEDVRFTMQITNADRFTFSWRLSLGDRLLESREDQPTCSFSYHTAQNGTYTADVLVREKKTGRCASLRRKIAMTAHPPIRKCTDPERMEDLFSMVDGMQISYRYGTLTASLAADMADDDVLYAFALVRDKTVTERRGYDPDPKASFPEVESGVYRIRYFICQNFECVCGVTDPIVIEDGVAIEPAPIRLRRA